MDSQDIHIYPEGAPDTLDHATPQVLQETDWGPSRQDDDLASRITVHSEEDFDPEAIVVFPEQPEPVAQPKLPPSNNSDVWICRIADPRRPVEVYLHTRARATIVRHALSNKHVEVGGVLIGEIYEYQNDAQGVPRTVVEISNGLPGLFTEGSSVKLTFTPETWSQILTDVETRFPNKRIVGWYHTHPGHGIFLSGDDKFLHNHFFPTLLALVVDPVQATAGFFFGNEKDPSGIRASSQFTWDATLYAPQASASQTTPKTPETGGTNQSAGSTLTSGQSPRPVEEHPKRSDSSPMQRPQDHADPGPDRTSPPSARQRPPSRVGRFLAWFPFPGRKSSQTANTQRKDQQGHTEQRNTEVLTISNSDLNSPEVQNAIRQQELLRRQYGHNDNPAATAVQDSMLGVVGCLLIAVSAVVLAVGIPLLALDAALTRIPLSEKLTSLLPAAFPLAIFLLGLFIGLLIHDLFFSRRT